MKRSRVLKALLVATVAACMGLLVSCSGQSEPAGNLAASGNGVSVTEDEVTELIQSNRASYGIDDDESWAHALIDAEMTPESYREQVIDSLVDQQLIKAGAESLGVTVESSEIDSHVDSIKKDLGIESDEGWADALKRAGFTEEEYRNNINDQLLQQALNTHFQDEVKLSDKELLKQAKTYMTYYDGAKRSSHILFGVDDTSDEAAMEEARNKAQAVLDQIVAGGDFAELAKENSTDTGSAENGGDVGWDVLNSFVSEYSDALAQLDKDQVSGLVESQYGIHIIKVTDVFNAPSKLKKLDQLPDEIRETITNMAKQTKANEDYQAWLKEQRDAAEVVVNPMPEDAPYNVDLTQYQNDESSDEAADADGESGDDSDDAEVVEVEEEPADSAEAAESSGEAADEASASAESEKK